MAGGSNTSGSGGGGGTGHTTTTNTNHKKRRGSLGENRKKHKGGGSGSSHGSATIDTSLSITALLTPVVVFFGIILAMILGSAELRSKVGIGRMMELFTLSSSSSSSSSSPWSSSSPPANEDSNEHTHQKATDINKRNPRNPQIESLFHQVCGRGDGGVDGSSATSAYCHESLFIDGRVLRVKERIESSSTSTPSKSSGIASSVDNRDDVSDDDAQQISQPSISSIDEDDASILLKIPRSYQIWDLDAMRDPYIREELIHASHTMTGNHLSSGAFLAAYVALQLQQLQSGQHTLSNLKLITNPIKLAYLQSLPTKQMLQEYHPVLWDKNEVESLIGRPSVVYNVIQAYRNMVLSEYDAFTKVSTTFATLISREQYATSRVNVLSRAYHVGTPTIEEQQFSTQHQIQIQTLNDELNAYRDLLHIDFTQDGDGCLALIPIADLLNHHPNNNVISNYKVGVGTDGTTGASADTASASSSSSNFVISVKDGTVVEVGTEPIISYGDIADAQLFGRYGFINGDGSGMTQVSLAHNHDVLNLNITDQYNYLPYSGTTTKILNYQKPQLIKYLRHDDGYEYCISSPITHPEEALLKKLKFQHLQRIANIRERWIIYLPPRNPKATPNTVVLNPLYYRKEQAYETFNIEPFLSTCRLMSLINSDYDGKAVDMLQDNLENADTFLLPKGNESLEFRAHMCIGRWIGSSLLSSELALGEIGTILESVRKLNIEDYGSKNWTARHVLFGEMQAYHSLRVLALEICEERWSNMKHNPPVEFLVRDDDCPEENYRYLLIPDEEPVLPPGEGGGGGVGSSSSEAEEIDVK